MSAVQLQRVVVRMLFDPAYTERVYADSKVALRETDVTEEEAAWLTQCDQRRWRADPLRSTRGLQALLEEFPVSALAACPAEQIPNLIDFFSSPEFHRAIMADSSLALSFATWLEETYPTSRPYSQLETAIARLRRVGFDDPTRFVSDDRWQTSPKVIALVVPGGTLEAYTAAIGVLNASSDGIVETLLSDPECLPQLQFDELESLLVETNGDIGVSEVSHELAQLLRYMANGHTESETISALLRFGSEAHEARDVLQSLVGDGLLTRPPRS